MKTNRHTENGTGRAQGFTLVEVSLAIVVVALGIMAAFSLISSGLDSSIAEILGMSMRKVSFPTAAALVCAPASMASSTYVSPPYISIAFHDP